MMAEGVALNAFCAQLAKLDRSGLRVAWTKEFKNAPPHFLSMTFMRKALIWHEQCLRHGGLSYDVKRALKAAGASKPARKLTTPMRSGTQLVREWNGKRYHVEVCDDGYAMDGQRFKSLSAIALHITGTSWSGPRFFGFANIGGGRS
jgi:hypothetical protein